MPQKFYSHINRALVQPSSNANSLNRYSPAPISVSKSKSHPCKKSRHGTSWVSFELAFDVFHCVMYHRSIDSSPSILPVNTFVYSRAAIQGVSIRTGLGKRPVYMAIKLLWYKTGQILHYTERKPFNFCAIIYYRTIQR